MSMIIKGGGSSNLADVNTGNQLKVVPETDALTNPSRVGCVRVFSENDPGSATGTPFLYSQEVDEDYRVRSSLETTFDSETFNYTAQNTGKHTYLNTTITATWSTAGFLTNATSVTTTTTGLTFGTYAEFPMIGSSVVYVEIEGGFTAQPTANVIVDFGLFRRGASTPYAPTDGAYFRLTSAGLFGVINSNGTEVTSSVFSFTYTNNKKYQFVMTVHERATRFWIDDVLYASIITPDGLGQPFMSASLPLSIRHAHVGTAGAVLQFNLNDYNVTVAGLDLNKYFGDINNAVFGSYQGLSGGTMGSLASYANSTNPTAAVPTNTTSTILTALGGQGWETDTLAVTTDGIIMSYQVPAGTISVQGKRLKVNGVIINSFVQTTLTGGGYNAQFSLCFGHTAVSLATAEAATTKAPRRIALGSYSVASGAAALVTLDKVSVTLANPIYVNSGEFIAIAKKKIGTAPSAGVIAYNIIIDYSWE